MLQKQAQGKEILHVAVEDGNSDEVYSALQRLETVASVDFAAGQTTTLSSILNRRCHRDGLFSAFVLRKGGHLRK
ncbi:MAG: hypothetical protein U5L09_14285 [Bacteroidales bacterium]|nr:hypothetical protein [Bacteroidales bacterium]